MPGGVRASKYRHTVQLGTGRKFTRPDGQVTTEFTRRNVAAEVVETSGTEKRNKDQTQATVHTRVTLRYRTDVGVGDQIMIGGRTLGIVKVGDVSGFRREIVCECEEVRT